MNWLDVFQDTDSELSLEEVAELELEHLEVAIPALLLSLRKEAGLTQAELAERMDCKEPHVSKLERASKRLPQIKTIVRYLNAVGARLVIGARYEDRVRDISYRTSYELAERKERCEVRIVPSTGYSVDEHAVGAVAYMRAS